MRAEVSYRRDGWRVGLGMCGLAVTLGAGPSCSRAGRAAEPVVQPAIVPVPGRYREWVYLSSGLDMTYVTPSGTGLPPPPNHDGQFDNVFVNPKSYRQFEETGQWPDETFFVLENRAAKANASINKGGRTQGVDLSGLELHVKHGNEWAFYGLQADGQEHLIPRPASCYSCHEAHAAVQTTFVQFYPTLLPIAETKHTLSAAYVAESRQAGAK